MEAVFSSTFGEIAALLVLAAVVGFFGLLLRQPLIVSFIIVGLIAGSSALDLVRSDAEIDLLSELGIVMLLFLVGTKLDLKLIRSLGTVSLLAGLGQVVVTAASAYLIGIALGLEPRANLYVSISLAFSSTIIIVKLLSDKREIDSLHGQIALGILIVQDLVVVVAMIALAAIGIRAESAGHGGATVESVLISGAVLVAFVAIFVRYIANPITERLAAAPELLVIFAIALASILATVGELVGLGKEIGGLMAGVALASTPYRETISARLAPLRDFLLLFFFIALGSTIDLSNFGRNAFNAATLSIFVLILKPLIVLTILGMMGFRKRTGFLSGVTLAQISEFSLIFIALGVSIGHLDQQSLGLVTMVGLVTIAASTYLITYSHDLYARFEPLLAKFERSGTPLEPHDDKTRVDPSPRIVVFGLGRFGTAIGRRLQQRAIDILGVDFNPEAVNQWRDIGLRAKFGDATDPEFISELPLEKTQWVVLTVSAYPPGLTHEDARTTLIQILRMTGYRGKIAVTSHDSGDVSRMLAAGADIVIEPFQEAADHSVDILCEPDESARH
ncbi:MAG: cation:proton antiporter [Steroidobacteraceae bacterium]